MDVESDAAGEADDGEEDLEDTDSEAEERELEGLYEGEA